MEINSVHTTEGNEIRETFSGSISLYKKIVESINSARPQDAVNIIDSIRQGHKVAIAHKLESNPLYAFVALVERGDFADQTLTRSQKETGWVK